MPDNLSSRKVKGVAEATIREVGAEMRFLPPYSPDLNPIEPAFGKFNFRQVQLSASSTFGKFKRLLRDGAERTADKLWNLCGRVLDLFPEHECRNYFRHCGYRCS